MAGCRVFCVSGAFSAGVYSHSIILRVSSMLQSFLLFARSYICHYAMYTKLD